MVIEGGRELMVDWPDDRKLIIVSNREPYVHKTGDDG